MSLKPTATGDGPVRSDSGTREGPDRVVQMLRVIAFPLSFAVVAIAALLIGMAPKELSLSMQGIKISFYLLQAVEEGGADRRKPTSSPDVSGIGRLAQKASSVSLAGTTVLWVDDHPENNEHERNALEQLGIKFEIATNTEEAKAVLANNSIGLIITDFSRGDDPNGGNTILSEAKKFRSNMPIIIYSSSANPEFDEAAKSKGAIGETNQPQQLFDWAMNALLKSQRLR